MSRASFALRGRNPDVLTCIANLSSDEVFTPPELANQMLDSVAVAWADTHRGESIWSNKTIKFLDPCTKTGVFLREITRRLMLGLAEQIPNAEERADHILTNQVYGIGLTKLTSLLARRSVYCSKLATSKHSIFRNALTEEGNILFKRLDHSWQGNRCRYCGGPRSVLERDPKTENYAYNFIHYEDPKLLLSEYYGEPMNFDVIIGNPPYQMEDDGFGTSASPIYQLFVEQAKTLNPKLLVMVIPSRWFAGGKGLDGFRSTMLADQNIRKIFDYEDASSVFPGVDIAGGICFFLWQHNSAGPCEVTNVYKETTSTDQRMLNEFPTFVRHNLALPLLRKIIAKREPSLSQRVSSRKPFGIATNVRPSTKGDIRLRWNGGEGPFLRNQVTTGSDLIDKWKVITSKVSYDHAGRPDKHGQRKVFSIIDILPPGVICTETYLVAGSFEEKAGAENLANYLRTRFVRFLVAQLSFSQDITKERFYFVPDLDMSEEWNDEKLLRRYGITDEEATYIETKIRSFDAIDAHPAKTLTDDDNGA